MIVRYEPQPGYMVPGWRKDEEREVSAEHGERLVATGQFADATPKPKPTTRKSSGKTESESDE